ncbi:calcium-translocating P-type ATPase, SERCA-type [Alteribacter lacisalsi]|uniref:Calcium-translocating P-type ATPase, SERCA-type n=1 Tax=Alteribacter lacisalsi TaxID=2045244 RepID=A0A2W0HAP8_9BACI|nr:calcium-translocating P-type ATPase, SERCA-type [Alteribacter lacisalsi]PYZ97961.1 calcium-translocating P-type ATPase, SERCA-type [Alteribacter lacisalsi]
MKWYEMEVEEVEQVIDTDASLGLNDEEAGMRLKKHGLNKLDDGRRTPLIFLFISQFKDFMVLVLLAATLVSGLLGEYIDALTIMIIVLLNGFLGFFQERKAEKSLASLKALSAPQMTVLRNGEWRKIPSTDAVIGDIVKLTAGDRVGADVRVITSESMYVEESALTGESLPVRKSKDPIRSSEALPLGDQENMAFMGTLVTQGSGTAVVVGSGMKTEMGKIAHLLKTTESMETPLQKRLEQLGKILIAAALLLTALVVLFGIIQGHDVYTMFLAGVSLAVAAIPEGLPAIVTVALALGVQRMIKRNAIVRKLPAVETLGCATVVCSDKTGTLTQNEMTVTSLYADHKTWSVTGSGFNPSGEFYSGSKEIKPSGEKPLWQLLTFGVLCNNSAIRQKDNGAYAVDGDPTEGALLAAGMKAGVSRNSLNDIYSVEKEFPFDSSRKMMSVIVKNKETGSRFIVTKGAPDVVLERSDFLLSNGRKGKMGRTEKEKQFRAVEEMASNALRTIAVASRELAPGEHIEAESDAERELTFIGIQGMIDPPREEVYGAIDECKRAGIKTVMITGDHGLTAKAIAVKLGMLPIGGKVLTGSQLAKMETPELSAIVDDVYVFARVTPEDKLKIVKALQSRGHIVAMTGDGVNDAPAIKAANIGIAMGTTGTDVAKEASSLILSDDNFKTIKAAIKEGRNIYDNIRKFIRYMLASNVGEILVMLFAMMLGMPLPLVAIQILWINLVTDGLPAMALGMDQPEDDVMKRKPRPPNESIFARKLGWKVVSRGFMIGTVTLFAFWQTYESSGQNLMLAQTVAFATLVMAQLIHVFDCRSEHSVFHRNPFENRYLVGAVISSILLMLVVLYYPPLQPIFHTVSLGFEHWLLILGCASVPTIALAGFQLFGRKETLGSRRSTMIK